MHEHWLENTSVTFAARVTKGPSIVARPVISQLSSF